MNTRSTTILALSALAIPNAHAAIAFNNFDTGDAFNTFAGHSLRGEGSSPNYVIQGFSFNSAASGQISLIKLAIQHVSGSHDVTFRLFDGTPANVGSLIASWSVTTTTEDHSGGTETIVNSNPLATLTAGSDYWLMGEAAPHSEIDWCDNSLGAKGPLAYSLDGGDSYAYLDNRTQSAFRVEVEPVPEPASVAVLSIGALALIRRRRSRKA